MPKVRVIRREFHSLLRKLNRAARIELRGVGIDSEGPGLAVQGPREAAARSCTAGIETDGLAEFLCRLVQLPLAPQGVSEIQPGVNVLRVEFQTLADAGWTA